MCPRMEKADGSGTYSLRTADKSKGDDIIRLLGIVVGYT